MGCGSSTQMAAPVIMGDSSEPPPSRFEPLDTRPTEMNGKPKPLWVRDDSPSSSQGTPLNKRTSTSFKSPSQLLRQGTTSMASMSPSVLLRGARRSKRRKGVASYGADSSTHGGNALGGTGETSDIEDIPLKSGDSKTSESNVEWLFERLSDPAYSHMVRQRRVGKHGVSFARPRGSSDATGSLEAGSALAQALVVATVPALWRFREASLWP